MPRSRPKYELLEPTDVGPNSVPHEQLAIWSMPAYLLASKEPAILNQATIVYDLYNGTRCTREVNSPTYPELFRIANELIIESKDHHHVFVEAFEYNNDDECWYLITGS